MTISLVDSAVACAIRIGVAQCSASFRAGLSGCVQSSVIGHPDEPQVMALLPEIHLPALHADLDNETLTDAERRMLRLAGLALSQRETRVIHPVPVPLALP